MRGPEQNRITGVELTPSSARRLRAAPMSGLFSCRVYSRSSTCRLEAVLALPMTIAWDLHRFLPPRRVHFHILRILFCPLSVSCNAQSQRFLCLWSSQLAASLNLAAALSEKLPITCPDPDRLGAERSEIASRLLNEACIPLPVSNTIPIAARPPPEDCHRSLASRAERIASVSSSVITTTTRGNLAK